MFRHAIHAVGRREDTPAVSDKRNRLGLDSYR